MGSFNCIFENNSLKALFGQNMKKVKILKLSPDFRYLQQLALNEKQSTQTCNLSTFVPFSKGFLNSEVVSTEITSRNIDTSSTRFGCLDQLALELDGESLVLGNWKSLAQKLGVLFTSLKMFQEKSYSNRGATIELFEYLHSHPSMTIKTLKEALAKMKRDDVLKILQEYLYNRYPSGKFDG